MRVTENLINNRALSDIQNVMRRYADLNSQLTSGKTVRYPSDNASVASRISNLDSRIREIDRYKSNIDLAETYTNMYDTTTKEVNSVFLRIKELAVQGANGTLSDEDRNSIVQELGKLNEHLISVANTKIGNRYIFGGAQSDKQPISSDGSVQTLPSANIKQKISVGGYNIEYGLTAYDTFVTKSGTTAFQIVDRLKQALADGKNDEIQNELGAIEEIQSKTLSATAQIGGTEKMLELSKTRMEDFNQFTTAYLSKESDADITKVLTDLKMQNMVLQSALKTTAQIVPPTLVDFMR
ncbi:flagellar hook-associated protein 3 [Tepiditoga spiralis]|uniref:Flagellar hook-associated protein 3 n=1 Tax=Tepiditoga spiralis TaxID=2108365 RepID=A0A7G1G2F0_9BACT|nr:flagellar hook-associated protein FlgL [Tepiditoga spiralis]BBE30448.1 flagellar hook-associated protein 3 [Tepiditoga spiralis]